MLLKILNFVKYWTSGNKRAALSHSLLFYQSRQYLELLTPSLSSPEMKNNIKCWINTDSCDSFTRIFSHRFFCRWNNLGIRLTLENKSSAFCHVLPTRFHSSPRATHLLSALSNSSTLFYSGTETSPFEEVWVQFTSPHINCCQRYAALRLPNSLALRFAGKGATHKPQVQAAPRDVPLCINLLKTALTMCQTLLSLCFLSYIPLF